MTGFVSLSLGLLLLTAAPQDSSTLPAAEPLPAVTRTETAGGSGPAPERGMALTGLPPRPAPPRTMEAHWPVFALFALSWVGIISFLIVTGRRSARLVSSLQEQEVQP